MSVGWPIGSPAGADTHGLFASSSRLPEVDRPSNAMRSARSLFRPDARLFRMRSRREMTLMVRTHKRSGTRFFHAVSNVSPEILVRVSIRHGGTPTMKTLPLAASSSAAGFSGRSGCLGRTPTTDRGRGDKRGGRNPTLELRQRPVWLGVESRRGLVERWSARIEWSNRRVSPPARPRRRGHQCLWNAYLRDVRTGIPFQMRRPARMSKTLMAHFEPTG